MEEDGNTRETGKRVPEIKVNESKIGGCFGRLPEEKSRLKAGGLFIILIFLVVHLFFAIFQIVTRPTHFVLVFTGAINVALLALAFWNGP